MSRLHGDDVELTDTDAALIKGMIARGDKNETIASFFGVNQRAISNVRSGQKFSHALTAGRADLPPPGPYGVDPIYVRFYRTMTRVDHLWSQRRMAEAKALMEEALQNPVFVEQLDAIGEAAAEMFRDEFGVLREQ